VGERRRRHGTVLVSFDVVYEPTISNERSKEARSQKLGTWDLGISDLSCVSPLIDQYIDSVEDIEIPLTARIHACLLDRYRVHKIDAGTHVSGIGLGRLSSDSDRVDDCCCDSGRKGANVYG
jgi:hypothetical protein